MIIARGAGRRPQLVALLTGIAILPAATGGLAGLCEELSPMSANVQSYGTDYLPRIDFHDGQAPAEACVRTLPAERPASLTFPLFAYNLQGEIGGARFRIVSSAPIDGFDAGRGLTLGGGGTATADGDLWYLDVDLGAVGVCGPVHLGDVTVRVLEETSGLFVDVAGYDGEPSPVIEYSLRDELPALAPRHGAYAGEVDLYHCQPPLCLEPNRAVTDLAPLQTGGMTIELGWTAGGGDFTMIRYRDDGIHPTSIYDGRQLVLMPTVAGHAYSVIHDDPQVVQYWYTAFSVTVAGEDVVLGSQLECGSMTTATVDESVPVEPATWGALKTMFR